ncbi:MAG: hypothetical protein LBL09_02500 [Oscillospiraceae bacterium]|jgi:hypothetical protein|nr:hypothetical protein [Oscillospiraceae bacterium]
MKKKIAIILPLLCIVAALSFIFAKDDNAISRGKYPYVGLSVTDISAVYPASEMAIMRDMTIELLAKNYDAAIIGKIITPASGEIKSYKLIPEKGTPEYRAHMSVAEEYGKSLEEVSVDVKYYEIEVLVQKSAGDELKTGDTMTLRIAAGSHLDRNELVFPPVGKGDKVILFISHNKYNELDFYSTSCSGFYYVTDNDNAVSAEKYESLDKYTGSDIYELFRHIEESFTATEKAN